MAYQLLLIDDDQEEYLITRDLLDEPKTGHHLVWASSYDDALQQMDQEPFDAYLLDYRLGKQSGIDLLRQMRARGVRAPVIILTGRGDEDVAEAALDAGATDYLDKNQLTTFALLRAVHYAIRQQQQQNQLEDLVKQVRELEQTKTDMIRIAAHDLRAPITVILGYVQYLKNDLYSDLEERYQGYINEIEEGAYRMRQIVSDILSLERANAIRGDFPDVVDLAEIAEAAYERYQRHAKQSFHLHCHDTDLKICGDANLLTEAIDNLITNAMKYTPEHGTIDMSVGKEGEMTFVRVKDTGYGIPEEQQEFLFQPFFRAPDVRKRQIEGTGLGLPIVKSIIERHGGTIVFQSTVNEGSEFGFTLPLCK